MKGIKEAVTGSNSKSKLKESLKETLGGYFGAKWTAPVNKEVVERW